MKKTKKVPVNVDEDVVEPIIEEIVKKDKKLKHYIDNDKLLIEMTKYAKEMKEYKQNREANPEMKSPRMTEYVGSCILKIAERLSSRPNFCGYTYKDEMVSDGVENAMMYSHNFNPEISKNAFAYLTQIIYFAFLRRISKEKEQFYAKMKLVRDSDIDGKFRNRLLKNYADKGEYIDPEEVYLKHFSLKELDVKNIEDKITSKSKIIEKKQKNQKKIKPKILDEFME
jgi:hypothetical protein